MSHRWMKTMVLGLVVVLVLSLGAVAAFAQDDTDVDTPAVPAVPFGRGGSFDRGHHGGDDEALAEALGISVEELQAARQKAAAARLAQAVEDGTLTQDQANTMLAMQALHGVLDRGALMAEALGLSVEEYEAAREDGSLSELLANITPAELQTEMQDAMEAAVQQAVADNIITQEQADLVLEQMSSGWGFHGGFGGHHGGPGGRHGGFRGMGGPIPSQPSAEGESIAPLPGFQGTSSSGA